MGKLKSEREKKLQRKLIPLNIFVCIIALVAALSLFLTPILKVDVGKILRDDGVMEFIDSKMDEVVGGEIEGTDQENIDYKPVINTLVKNVLGSAEGEISVSALSAFRVLTSSGDKTQMVMDDLLFGDNALATKLINSVVDGVANIFETEEGKTVLEEAVISVMAKEIMKNVPDENKDSLTNGDIKELVGIIRELSDPENVPDGKVDAVAGKFVDKVDEMLGDDVVIAEEDRQSLIDEVQSLYDTTIENLKEGETVSMESIICVTLSKTVDLSEINIEDFIDDIFGSENGGENGEENTEGSVHIRAVEEQVGGADAGSPEVGGSTEGDAGEGSGGGETETTQKIVTNYDDLLLEIGYNKEQKDDLKEKMRTKLNSLLNDTIQENGIDDYMGYYEYIFYGMLVFIGPWLILFLFSFFHMLAKNKRFTMWYVKLICWIPPLIWLVLKLFPVVAPKVSFLNDMWNGENSAVMKAAFAGISSFTWISGLCYLLLWFVSIFWAFPIKHKIRKERKNPEVEDAYDEYEEY